MKDYHKNPRQITRDQFEDLEKWLDELGDLSGVVHDLNSDEIIGGNQRSHVFNINECEIEIVQEFDEADRQGTVALGFVIWRGNRFNYRRVRWTKEQCEKANIIANKAGGSFDFDILANQFEIPDLLEWGFKRYEFGMMDGDDDQTDQWGGMPEFGENPLAYQSVHVHFKNAEDAKAFADLIKQQITERTRSLWYPAAIKRDLKSQGYISR